MGVCVCVVGVRRVDGKELVLKGVGMLKNRETLVGAFGGGKRDRHNCSCLWKADRCSRGTAACRPSSCLCSSTQHLPPSPATVVTTPKPHNPFYLLAPSRVLPLYGLEPSRPPNVKQLEGDGVQGATN